MLTVSSYQTMHYVFLPNPYWDFWRLSGPTRISPIHPRLSWSESPDSFTGLKFQVKGVDWLGPLFAQARSQGMNVGLDLGSKPGTTDVEWRCVSCSWLAIVLLTVLPSYSPVPQMFSAYLLGFSFLESCFTLSPCWFFHSCICFMEIF